MWSLFTCFTVKLEVFLIHDRCVCVSMKVRDVRLGTSDGGPKEEMGSSESEVLLVVTGEGKTEWCGSAVGGEVHVMYQAIVWPFVGAVEV